MFPLSVFTDGRFMTATEKRSVLRHWQRFLSTLASHYGDRDRCFRAFSRPLYQHLHLHCSFIAHYDRSGFYDWYFTEPTQTAAFLSQFDCQSNPTGLSVEYGMSYWLQGEYADINTAMRNVADSWLPRITARLNHL